MGVHNKKLHLFLLLIDFSYGPGCLPEKPFRGTPKSVAPVASHILLINFSYAFLLLIEFSYGPGCLPEKPFRLMMTDDD